MGSPFSWILSDSWVGTPTDTKNTSQLLCLANIKDSDLRSFWDLESVDIRPESEKSAADYLVQEFPEMYHW